MHLAMDSDSDEDVGLQQFKVIILGDGSVGKTSVAQRFTGDNFAQAYKQTIGLDFYAKQMALPEGNEVTLQVWDIGGQSIGGNMIGNYVYGAHAVIMMYDITNYQSFQNLDDWYRLVRKTYSTEKMPLIVLVGNKTDLSYQRAVRLQKHQDFASLNDFMSFFVCAKSGDNINAMFYRIAARLAGVGVSKADVDVQQRVVDAQVVDHPTMEPLAKSKQGCVAM
ncbi:Ras-related protein Rab-28 [Carpediemonas membranifera]|uniref:Ras-related protein Rab-28 n=1 Tax=Carpediemonas membranifera TaxID=201153 RepID=A0A8J6APL3_9EUKA|nr:Ras-related protein Rab-28 [Carpediemonas membranifera]|eukprot:KAG9389623.1 Ras-related protein Rab-28 [Carpediemonas membranifera]